MSAFNPDLLTYLANSSHTTITNIRSYLHLAPRRYKEYEIPKRNGAGTRTIAQPTKALKIMQKKIQSQFFLRLPVHACATAYIKGQGIHFNASQHAGNSYLLKMDFSNYFPSIVPNDLHSHVEKHLGEYSENDRFVIENLFFYRPTKKGSLRLSIGAPSSPFLSNTIMYGFDNLVKSLCDEANVTYTRYADDLAFSTNEKNLLYSYPKQIRQICKGIAYPSLVINRKKTVFSSKANNRHITGLVLTNDNKVSLGRSKKRYIKSLVYGFMNQTLEGEQIPHLRGLIAYAIDVEPSFVQSLKNKYGNATIQQILK